MIKVRKRKNMSRVRQVKGGFQEALFLIDEFGDRYSLHIDQIESKLVLIKEISDEG